jgi:DNA invertase Pin-like site-specific DNA recombinase
MGMRTIQAIKREAAITQTHETEQLRRVAAYCRVSTLQEEQDESYETQCEYFRSRIAADPTLTLVEVYGDHGISGLSAAKRPEFMRMMDDCMEDKIDLIMTKSISRFARNLADCIESIRDLREKGIPVIFEKERLNTMDSGCEMMLSVLATLAQEESNAISRNIRWAHEQRNSQGKPVRRASYGYRRSGVKWEIFEPESERVRLAFRMAGEGSTYREIIYALNRLEVGDNTNIVWSRGRVYRILTNEAYIGDILTNKTFKPDFLSRNSVINKGQRSQYYIEGHHEGIVDRDTFERVGELIKSRVRKSEKTRSRV